MHIMNLKFAPQVANLSKWSRFSISRARSKQHGVALIEMSLVAALTLIGTLSMLSFGIGLDRWSKLEACIREGVRDSVAAKSSSANYLSTIRANILARATNKGLNVPLSAIHVCVVEDYVTPYPPAPPPICTTESVGTFGGAFYVTATDRFSFLWGVPWEINLVSDAFFLY
jgi:Flp pilus assembly protein TadG